MIEGIWRSREISVTVAGGVFSLLLPFGLLPGESTSSLSLRSKLLKVI